MSRGDCYSEVLVIHFSGVREGWQSETRVSSIGGGSLFRVNYSVVGYPVMYGFVELEGYVYLGSSVLLLPVLKWYVE